MSNQTDYSKAKHSLLEGWKVLVVDDNADSAQVIGDVLKACGATVFLAENGNEGYERALEVLPHFIISDIMMPIASGWDLIEKLKADVRTRDIPAIALTAHSSSQDRELAISRGFHNYLSKPFEVQSLLSQILTLIEDVEDLGEQLAQRLRA
jgi:CheY-like chemotaxis protein